MNIHELYDIYLSHRAIQTDTRKLQKGELFFALKGDNFDGNLFAAQAIESGAAFAIVDDPKLEGSPGMIVVEDVLQTLQELAAHHRLQLEIPILAITGSNGKTTTKELLYTVLSAKYNTYATEGNLNNHIGVPLSLLRITEDTEIAIIEMGANHIGEIASYCRIAFPDFGIINNIGKAHLEGFGSLEGVKKAKGELYDYLRQFEGSVFRNADLDYLTEMSEGITEQITYGTSNAQFIGRAISEGPLLKVAMLSSGLECRIQTNLVGDYNLPNVLAAVAVGSHFGIDIDSIKKAIESYQPSNNRSQWMQSGTNQIILDAYNANPSSMKLALENLATLPATNKWVLLGAMKEMGDESKSEHEALVALATNLGFEHVLLTGHEFEGLQQDYLWFENSEAARNYLRENPIRNATILIKGSRGSRMEVILDAVNV